MDQIKIPFPIAKEAGGLPLKCRPCFHREGRMCFNDKLKEVPTRWHSFTDKEGIERGYNQRIGNEITDDYFRECQAVRAFANRRMTILGALVGHSNIRNEHGGEAS